MTPNIGLLDLSMLRLDRTRKSEGWRYVSKRGSLRRPKQWPMAARERHPWCSFVGGRKAQLGARGGHSQHIVTNGALFGRSKFDEDPSLHDKDEIERGSQKNVRSCTGQPIFRGNWR